MEMEESELDQFLQDEFDNEEIQEETSLKKWPEQTTHRDDTNEGFSSGSLVEKQTHQQEPVGGSLSLAESLYPSLESETLPASSRGMGKGIPESSISKTKSELLESFRIVNTSKRSDANQREKSLGPENESVLDSRKSEVAMASNQKHQYDATNRFWSSLFSLVDLPDSSVAVYTKLFSHLSIGEDKALKMKAKDFARIGIANKAHCKLLVEALKKFKKKSNPKTSKNIKTADKVIQKPSINAEAKEAASTDLPNRDESIGNESIELFWYQALLNEGIPREDSKGYAQKLSSYDINEDFISSFSEKDLVQCGVTDPSHRDILYKLIQHVMADEQGEVRKTQEENDPDQIFPDDILASCWYGVMTESGLESIKAQKYAKLLSENEIAESNAETVDDDSLISFGIESSEDRQFILNLLRSLITQYKESIEAASTIEEKTEQERKELSADIDRILEKQNIFEQQLSAILSGNTERQKKLRAERMQQRKEREERRVEKRRERLLRKARLQLDELQSRIKK